MAQDIKYAYMGNLTAKRGDDGYLRVKGIATDDTLDLDQQICDPDWLKSEMPKWMEIGNIREMHQSKAVGKAMEMEQVGNGFVVEAKIVDPVAAKMVEEGIYTGFSIGIKNARVVKDAAAPGGRIIQGSVVEISLVDRPANPSAVIEIAKSIDGELVKGAAMADTEKMADSPEMNADALASEVPVNPEINEPRADAFQPCPACGGSGHKSNVDAEALTQIRCEECDGSGRAPEGIHENIQQASPSTDKENDVNHEIKASDPDATAEAEPEVEKREFTDAERADAAEAGQALPDGSYPIKTVKDLKNAIQSFGRASDKPKVKAHIKARAVALGREDLVPENWKSVDADVAKADDMMHDPADLAAVRAGLIALIKAELDEMLAGDENEICDVTELLCSLKIFLDWWTSEASENETDAPFTGWDENKDDDTMAYIGLGVSADLIKSASAPDATDETKNSLRDEIRKSLGVDEVIATYKAALAEQEERIETLKSALDEVREMAAPGGPAIRANHVQTQKSAQVEALKIEAEGYRLKAAQITSPELRNSYLDAARAIEARLEQF